jgi:PIN domain nuclease of toxin-antitoxin system
MDWSHCDPSDRILAATAELTGAPLLSAEPVFDKFLPGIRGIW